MVTSTGTMFGEHTLSVLCNRTLCEINTFTGDVIQAQRKVDDTEQYQSRPIMFVVACTSFLTLFMSTITCLILLKLFRRHPYKDRTSYIKSSWDQEQFELSLHHSTQRTSNAGHESLVTRRRSNRRSIFPSGFYDMIDSNEMEESNATYVPPDFANETIMILHSEDDSADSCESDNEYVAKEAASRTVPGSPRYIDHPKAMIQYENLPDWKTFTNSNQRTQADSHSSYPVIDHYIFDVTNTNTATAEKDEMPDEESLDVDIPLNESYMKRRSRNLSKPKSSPPNQEYLEPQPSDLGYLCPTSLGAGSTSARMLDDPVYLRPLTDGAGFPRKLQDDGYLVPQNGDAGYVIPQSEATETEVKKRQFHARSRSPYKVDDIRKTNANSDTTPNTSRHSRRYIRHNNRASGLQHGSQPEMRSAGRKPRGRECYSLVPAYIRTTNIKSSPDKDLLTKKPGAKTVDPDTPQVLKPESNHAMRKVYILKKREHSSNKRAKSMLVSDPGQSPVAVEIRNKKRPQSDNSKLFSTPKIRRAPKEPNGEASEASLQPMFERQSGETSTCNMNGASSRNDRALSQATEPRISDRVSSKLSLGSLNKNTLDVTQHTPTELRNPLIKSRSPSYLLRTSLTLNAPGTSMIHERRSLPVYSTFKPPGSLEEDDNCSGNESDTKVTTLLTAESQDMVPVNTADANPNDSNTNSDDHKMHPDGSCSPDSSPAEPVEKAGEITPEAANNANNDPPQMDIVLRTVPTYVCMAGRASPTLPRAMGSGKSSPRHPMNDHSKTLAPGASAGCLSRIPKASSMGSQSVPVTPKPRRPQKPAHATNEPFEEEDDSRSSVAARHPVSLGDNVCTDGGGEFIQAQRKAQSLPGTPYLSARPQIGQLENNYVNL